MTHICFVTDELYPITPGGAGALIYNSIKALKQQGHSVSLLLDVNKESFSRSVSFFASDCSEVKVDNIYWVEQLAQDLPPYNSDHFGEWYYWRSYRLYWTLLKVVQLVRPDFVEFNDFFGSAYYSIAAKSSQIAFAQTFIGIRLHSPWEMLLQAGDVAQVAPYTLAIRYLERAALRLAEYILSPSASYAQAMFLPYYETGLGEILISAPALFKWPAEVNFTDNPNIILYYGRLHPCKGIDRYLAACVDMAQRFPEVEFWLVGGDSVMTRDAISSSYKEFIKEHIPTSIRHRFNFAGVLKFEDLDLILPRVRFAVFPNYYESFCYAAHELYQARVPIIVSNIPSFRNVFVHEKNSLVFDGTIKDLIRQMERLYLDDNLRTQLARPFLVKDDALGDRYQTLPRQSWTSDTVGNTDIVDILLIIINDGLGDLETTLASASQQLCKNDRLVILDEVKRDIVEGVFVLFDQSYIARSLQGTVLGPSDLETKAALLILEAGDQLSSLALKHWRNTLTNRPQISFVSSWRQVNSLNGKDTIDCLPFEICLDQLLFVPRSLRQRVLMRTKPGLRIDDVFDIRLGPLGELGYLWNLDYQHGPGLSLPEVLLICRAEKQITPLNEYSAIVAYLVSQDLSPQRQKSLALRALLIQKIGPRQILQELIKEKEQFKILKYKRLAMWFRKILQWARITWTKR